MKSLDYRTWGLVEVEVGRRLAQHRTGSGHHALGATLGCGHPEGLDYAVAEQRRHEHLSRTVGLVSIAPA